VTGKGWLGKGCDPPRLKLLQAACEASIAVQPETAVGHGIFLLIFLSACERFFMGDGGVSSEIAALEPAMAGFSMQASASDH
jgi:hypothetical protein